tara:strand:- start:491 stop:730 length:240 start_codon:yes stop_codon:yes gene_type:complete
MKKLLLATVLLVGCQTYHAPSGEAFPTSWGPPPEIQTKDYRKLQEDYGYGSSTLYNWIDRKLHDTKYDIPGDYHNPFTL